MQVDIHTWLGLAHTLSYIHVAFTSFQNFLWYGKNLQLPVRV